MAGSGGGSASDSLTQKTPWDPTQPHLISAMERAKDIYNYDISGNNSVWNGKLQADQPDSLSRAFGMMSNVAGNAPSLNGVLGQATASAGGGGSDPNQSGALGTLSAIMRGGNAINTGSQFGNVAASAGAPTNSDYYMPNQINRASQASASDNFQQNLRTQNTTNTEQLGPGLLSNLSQPTAADRIGGNVAANVQGATHADYYAPHSINRMNQASAADNYGNSIVRGAAGPTAADQFAPSIQNMSRGQTQAERYAPSIPGNIPSASQLYAPKLTNAGPTSSETNLAAMASGKDAGQNPALLAMLEDNASRINNQVASSMSGAGRFGSFAHGDAMARSIASANNPLLAQTYENDRNRMLSASGQIDASRNAAGALGLQAAGQSDDARIANQSLGLQGAMAADTSRMNAGRLGLDATSMLDTARMNAGQLGLQGAGLMDSVRQGRENAILQGAGLLDQSRATANDTALRGAGLMDQSRLANNTLGLNTAGQMDASRQSRDALGLTTAGQVDQVRAAREAQIAASSGQMDQMRNAANATQLNALSGLTGVQGQNIANQAGAASGLLDQLNTNTGNAQQWASMIPGLMDAQYMGADRMAQMGEYNQNRADQLLAARQAAFDERNNAPWAQLAKYQGSIMGQAPILQGMGTAFGNTDTDASAPWFGPTGTVGNIGSLGMALLSDRNEKTDIKKIGTSGETGLDIYSYRYKGDPKNYPKVVGPMAQDIEKKYPGSTGLLDGKMYVKPEAAGLLGAL